MNLFERHAQGLDYDAFIGRYATDVQKERWRTVHGQVFLSEAQRTLLRSFKRRMPVLCLAGAWCGDCINQCPIFAHFTQASPKIQVLYFDRDAHPDLASALSVCG